MSAISADYAIPVQVNGYTCHNCTDVANAKKNIDPEHPQSGPFNVNAATDPTRVTEPTKPSDAVSATGSLLDVSA